jgi:hypothetical protein
MCKEMPVIPVKKMVDKKEQLKKGGPRRKGKGTRSR